MAGAWATLGYGLLFSTPDRHAWQELEAGGRYAANIFVYLPCYGLTLPVAAVVVLGLVWTRDRLFPLMASTAVGIALFACWVAVHDFLLKAQPQLMASVAWCLVASVVAVAALIGARLTHPPGPPPPSSRG